MAITFNLFTWKTSHKEVIWKFIAVFHVNKNVHTYLQKAPLQSVWKVILSAFYYEK